MACCLETFITIGVCTVYVGGAIGTQVFDPKIIIIIITIIIIIKITIKDKKELIHCHMNTHNHMNINHVLCKYVYLERVVDPSCCCCFYTCQSLSALVYIHELMQPKPVVTSYIPDRSVYVYL